MQYENPVLPGFHPDPSICRVGSDYYLATSSFEYTPGIPLYHSENLVDWEPIGHCLTADQLDLEDAEPSQGIFAPTLRHHEGTFYLVTTNVSAGGHFVITADEPTGEWSDPLWIDAPGIDPDLFWDDGTAYFTYRSGPDGIEQAEIDLETGELGESTQLCRRLVSDYTEAPHLYEVDGTYYLIVAEGGTHTRHMVCAARADDPTGPFEPCPNNPILSHRSVSGAYNPIQAIGHADLVEAHDGSWWLVCLGIRKHGGHPGWHHLGRETFLAPVTWEDGWPVVNDGEPLEAEMTVPDTALETGETQSWETTAPFDGDELGPLWNYRYPPETDRYVLEDGILTLHGGPATLDDRDSTFVGRRQQHFDCKVETELVFNPEADGEAGLTALYDESHHYEIGLTREDGNRVVVARATVGDISDRLGEVRVPEGPVTLRLEATQDEYDWRVETTEGTEHLATAPTKYLATEVAGGFTGVYLGPYATGNGNECDQPAHFESFAYRSSE
ncbi:glycoside hydrolase family 43 protein [Natronolimnobius sp. AArcel1]|uniref:glycoside hydrolase family 43 protein n=1 Tax=Natronolimnobius sp. AArcel1 TaxID=1679093 RepID=UPI0013EDC627|nr:glycoside hydrolase family 43 protein [Natronolimnobius sp. AArcel1]NGM69819.1 glycoside hydrolase family 43 protein [Natronolimnobius sp. AArcel1]